MTVQYMQSVMLIYFNILLVVTLRNCLKGYVTQDCREFIIHP